MWLISHWERISAEYETEKAKNSTPQKLTRSASADHDNTQTRIRDSHGTSRDTLTTGRLGNPCQTKENPVSCPSPYQGHPSRITQQIQWKAYHTGNTAPETRRDSMTSGSTASSDSELPEVEHITHGHSAVSRSWKLSESAQMHSPHQIQGALPQYGSRKLGVRYTPDDVDDASVYSSGKQWSYHNYV